MNPAPSLPWPKLTSSSLSFSLGPCADSSYLNRKRQLLTFLTRHRGVLLRGGGDAEEMWVEMCSSLPLCFGKLGFICLFHVT